VILVDASVWIDLFRSRDTVQTRFLTEVLQLQTSLVLVGDLIVMELLQGCRDDLHAARMQSTLAVSPCISIADPDMVAIAASNYRHLRARGITVRKTIDTLIATRCILDDIPLLYSDRDFDPFVEHLELQSALALS